MEPQTGMAEGGDCSLICHKSPTSHRSPGADPCWATRPHERTRAVRPNLMCIHVRIRHVTTNQPVKVLKGRQEDC